jgi:hypothetical protein
MRDDAVFGIKLIQLTYCRREIALAFGMPSMIHLLDKHFLVVTRRIPTFSLTYID